MAAAAQRGTATPARRRFPSTRTAPARRRAPSERRRVTWAAPQGAGPGPAPCLRGDAVRPAPPSYTPPGCSAGAFPARHVLPVNASPPPAMVTPPGPLSGGR